MINFEKTLIYFSIIIISQRNRNILIVAGNILNIDKTQYSIFIFDKKNLINGYIYALEASFMFNSEILTAYPLNIGINTYLIL